jgi:filamentous hemagglutinin
MASAVNQQSRLNLSVGVALTGSQVSALTQSLVWWVQTSVNGRNALVPVVYLAAADQKTITNGAIIAGANVVARVAGDIRNTGTISGANLVSLTAELR